MKYRNRLTGLVVTTDREKTSAKWERLDVEDLIAPYVPPMPGFVVLSDPDGEEE